MLYESFDDEEKILNKNNEINLLKKDLIEIPYYNSDDLANTLVKLMSLYENKEYIHENKEIPFHTIKPKTEDGIEYTFKESLTGYTYLPPIHFLYYVEPMIGSGRRNYNDFGKVAIGSIEEGTDFNEIWYVENFITYLYQRKKDHDINYKNKQFDTFSILDEYLNDNKEEKLTREEQIIRKGLKERNNNKKQFVMKKRLCDDVYKIMDLIRQIQYIKKSCSKIPYYDTCDLCNSLIMLMSIYDKKQYTYDIGETLDNEFSFVIKPIIEDGTELYFKTTRNYLVYLPPRYLSQDDSIKTNADLDKIEYVEEFIKYLYERKKDHDINNRDSKFYVSDILTEYLEGTKTTYKQKKR